MVGLTSAAGLVGFLSEPDPELKIYALKRLNEEVNLLWTEVADSVGQMSVPCAHTRKDVHDTGTPALRWLPHLHLHLPPCGCISTDRSASCREALYEDESFPERELAALVISKVYYHLQEYNESMTFALGAGKLFNLDQEGEFEETIICTRHFPRTI